jgi:hypothetical protein
LTAEREARFMSPQKTKTRQKIHKQKEAEVVGSNNPTGPFLSVWYCFEFDLKRKADSF